MNSERDMEELFLFFEQYAEFLTHMTRDEDEKLHALLSNSLPRIEHSISVAQANAKQMENMELKRIRMQERAGLAGLTFSEILEWVPDEERDSWQSLFWRIQDCADEIKFRNGKSMSVARSNLLERDPEAVIPGELNSQTSAYIKVKERIREGQTSLLETKI